MTPLEELASHLSGSSRAIVISNRDVDLRPGAEDNRLFVLKIGEGSLAAGGRGGGFGERKVTEVVCFERCKGEWAKRFEAQGEDEASKFEVPYYVSRLPLTLADGAETMGYGAVDPALVAEMSARSKIGSSA
ncbi:MAG: hypothetical protein JRN06_01075 [Nitrososphaerota archaeon]|nr:hypothetical protein [Nitrososphaerota archaeon]MDG7023555.1 hypothetical protein [Nitrososphaerota archaeon]